MNGVLHSDRNEFSSILERTKKLAEKRLNNQDELPAGVRVEGFHLQDMPEKGIGAKASIDFSFICKTCPKKESVPKLRLISSKSISLTR